MFRCLLLRALDLTPGLNIGSALRDGIGLHASTSGRQAAERTMTSLSRTGVPGPDMAVAHTLSQYYGGHDARRIKLAPTALELNELLDAQRLTLKPIHLGVAALRLEQLAKSGKLTPNTSHALHFRSIAFNLEALAVKRAVRLVLWQISGLLRGLTSVGHTMKPHSLLLLAARVVSDDCQRLKFASDKDVHEIVQGFVAQGYSNPVFWDKVCSGITPRMASFDLSRLSIILANVPVEEAASPQRGELIAAATSTLAPRAVDLAPKLFVDLVKKLSILPTWAALKIEPELMQQLPALGGAALRGGPGRLPPKQAALLCSAFSRLFDDKLPGEMRAALVAWMEEETAAPTPGLKLQHLAAIAKSLSQSGCLDSDVYEAVSALALALVNGAESGTLLQAKDSNTRPWVLSLAIDAFSSDGVRSAASAEKLVLLAKTKLSIN